MIVLGASAFNTFLALSQLPQELAAWVGGQGFGPYAVLSAMLVFYLVFGCVMDSLSMILLTVPIFFPMFVSLDFGLPPEHAAIWFGVLVLIVVEVGLITPPVGMNLFVIQSMAPDISIRDTYRGVLPSGLQPALAVRADDAAQQPFLLAKFRTEQAAHEAHRCRLLANDDG
jgi:TRAP-type C4-dicarboxylate transport system permease large subunit